MRGSGSQFYYTFHQHNTVWRFTFDEPERIFTGQYDRLKYLDEYYSPLVGLEPDAAFKYNGDVFFIIGKAAPMQRIDLYQLMKASSTVMCVHLNILGLIPF